MKSNRIVRTGSAPAIALINPKYRRNLGEVIRAASCFGVDQVWYTGDRAELAPGERAPREERMKAYSDVELIKDSYFFDRFPKDVVPVAVEIVPGAELLPQFIHPDKALYVFGSEDGHIPSVIKRHCKRFVTIPTKHCTNLAAAVYITLYDRMVKRQAAGLDPVLPMREILKEERTVYGML